MPHSFQTTTAHGIRLLVAIVFPVWLCFLLSGCGGSSGSGTTDGNASPAAHITGPADDSSYTYEDLVQFRGTATDSEDGTLDSTSLAWTSDLDGALGTGDSLDLDTLCTGLHQITLTATDSGNATGSDTIEITVSGSNPIPDTGQTTSYTDTVGEDSDYTIHPPSYTKLDDAGADLDAGAADWAMVKDNVTGLVWEVKTDDGGINDKDNTYTWQDARDVFIAQLNTDHFGGYTDWRMPTVKELSFLVNADAFNPAISTAFFPNTISSVYCSSTAYVDSTDVAWSVNFSSSSYADIHLKLIGFYVRAVRGGQ